MTGADLTSGEKPDDAAPKLSHVESVIVDASPETLYAMVSDVTRHGEWSPICRGCEWDDADAGAQVGAWFTGHNEARGRVWETHSQIVVAEPGREFAFLVGQGFVRWGYSFAAEPGGGTELTESWDFRPAGIAMFHQRYGARADDQIALRSADALAGIPVTLAAIKQAAESSE